MRKRLLARLALLVALVLVVPSFGSFQMETPNPGKVDAGETIGTASPDGQSASAFRSHGRGRALSPTAPDIVLSGLNWSLSAPDDGAALKIFATLFNDGTDLASSFVVDLLVDGVSAGSPVVSGLTGGGFATVHADWTVRPGPHELVAVADPGNNVREANETNNLRMGSLDIPYPDLLIQNVSWYPRDYRNGDTVTFVVTVHNQGAGGTARAVALESRMDQFQLNNQVIGGLGAGSTTQASFAWTALSGNHTLFLSVDPANAVREATKTNNRAAVRLGRDFPDILVTNITLPANLTDGRPAALGALVHNAGPAGTTATFPVAFLVDGEAAGTVNVYGLAANASRNITVEWTARPGLHVLRVEADPDGRLGEAVETNNYLLREFTVAYPQLSVRDAVWEQSLPTDGREVRFNITVQNSGAGSTERPVQVRLLVDGQEGDRAVVQGLAAGAQASVGALWTALPGRHELRVEADPDGLVDESDETDNFIMREISVPYPDISLSNLTAFPPNPESGESVRLSAVVQNTGPGNTSRRFAVSFFAGGLKLATAMVDGLDRGAVQSLGADWTARPGTTDLAVVADELDDVAELDELDNLATSRVNAGWPDISAGITSWSPANAVSGQALNVTVSIRNTGANTSAPFDIGLYDNGSLAASVPVPGMRAGALIVQNLSLVLRSVPTTIRLSADYGNAVAELSELDNVFEFTYPAGAVLPRPAPVDLAFKEVRLFPDQPADGETLTVLAAVNLATPGDPPFSEVHLGCALDGASSLERTVALSAGEGVASFEFRAPPGAHRLILTIDPGRRLAQSRADNDQSFSAFTILAPDPMIAGITPAAANATDGDSASVTCAVRNNGPGSTRSDVSVRLLLDGKPVLSQTLKGLVNGTESTVVFTFEAFPGTHRLKAEIVRQGRLRQTDVGNDQAFSALTVGRPQITVSSIDAPASADEGAPVSIVAAVSNAGASTVRNFLVRFFVDGVRLGDSTVGGLFAGRSTTVVREWTAAPGAHRIMVVADALGAVGEAGESDNRLARAAVNVSRPDLRVSNLRFTQQPLDGAECLASAELTNAGNATTRAVSVQFFLDESQAGLVTLDAVPANATLTVAKRFTAAAGPHLLRVAAGTAGRPAESNETDNDALLAVNGTGWADLVLSGLKVPPAAVDGAEVRLFAEVDNAGGSTVRRFTVGFFVDGQKVGDDQVEGLPAGGSAACSAAWKATPGRHSVRAVVDQDDVVWELDETDNSMRRDGPAVEQPDITVLSVTAAPAPARGAPAQHRVFVTLENIGGPTLRGFAATVYLDAVPAGNVYSDGLPGRNTTQVSLLVPSGSASTVAVKADEEGALAEGDESNNAASFAFAPVPELETDRSDLVVRGLWMVPSDPADGQPVRVFAAIGNDGNGTLLNRSRVQMVHQGRNMSSTLEALAPGGTTVAGFDVIAGGGTMAFNATVAHGDPRFESRSDNNRLGASFTAMVPDIRAASVWRSNTTEGLEAPMFAVVENNLTNGSTGDALGGFAVEINIGGGLFVQKAVGGLLAGERHYVAFNWRAQPGETDIVAVADPAGAVSDADHGNDRLHDIADTGYPDLLVANITWPALWQNGERTSVFVDVRNDGAATGRAVSVTLSADAALLGTARLAAMAAFSSTILAFDWSPSPGNHSFTASVDPGDEMAESSENNNRLVKEMPSGAVSPGPPAVNLHLSGLGYAQWRLPGKGADNQTNVYGLNFTVTNDGEANTSFCAARLLIDGLQVAELVVPPLSANASANLSFNWLAQYGDYRYKVVLDSRRQLAEDLETDNDDAISIAGNRAPVATTGGPYTASYGDPLTLKGQGFDTNGYIALYEWDLDGDGRFGGRNDTSSTTTGTVTRIFHTAGLYRVSLRVTDDMGATATQTTTVLVKAKPAPPGLDFNALSIVGMTIVFVICSLVVLTILRSEGRIFRRKGR